MRKRLKSLCGRRAVIIGAVAAVAGLLLVCWLGGRAKALGKGIGETAGKTVGIAVGSFRGVTEGTEKGRKEGMQAGLSAEDTAVDIRSSILSIGKLEVLSAGISLRNVTELGEVYEYIEIVKGTAMFSVDLSIADVQVSRDGSAVRVILPEPDMETYITYNDTEKLAEESGFSPFHNAENGSAAYLQSISRTITEAKENISNYDMLLQMAKDSARQQVGLLVANLRSAECSVDIVFQ